MVGLNVREVTFNGEALDSPAYTKSIVVVCGLINCCIKVIYNIARTTIAIIG